MGKNIEDEKFIVDTTVVEELGRNLYSSDNSIIVELIANSYDADASTVIITFDHINKKIIIQDNGSGMTRQILKDGFLTVGKKDFKKPQSEKGRITLGRKGIGKLSFFAIGNKITISTKHKDDLRYSFNLDYNDLISGESNSNDIKLISEDVPLNAIFSQGTLIEISDLLPGSSKKEFIKKIIIGISQTFTNLIDNEFEIKIIIPNEIDIPEVSSDSLQGEYKFEKIKPDFSKTLIFYSLDNETDKLIAKIQSESKDHLNNLIDDTKLTEYDLSIFKDSTEVWKSIDSAKLFENYEWPHDLKKYDIKGYIASIVTTKNVSKHIPESLQSNDKIIIKDDIIQVMASNRRISIESKQRIGMLNAKSSLGLSDKFYTKYLFGEISSKMLEDKEFDKSDVVSPNREGYNRDNDRWEYIQRVLKYLGNNAMNFANEIAKVKKEKNEKMLFEDSNNIYSQLSEEIDAKFPEDIREKANVLLKKAVAQTSRKKIEYDKEVQTGFILLSYKNTGEQSREYAEKTYHVLKELIPNDSSIRIFCTAIDSAGIIKGEERLYYTIKQGFWKDPHDFHKFHMFAFINEDFTHNWQTDIEYGMAFVNSELVSGTLIPDQITPIKCGKVSADELVKCDPLTYDMLMTVESDLARRIQKVLKTMWVEKSITEIQTVIDKYFK